MHECMPMSKRLMPRAAATFSLTAVVAVAIVPVACVTPQNDFDDYMSRAADAQGLVQPGSGDAGVDTGPQYAPDASIPSSTYFMSCLSQLAAVPAQASSFTATLAYTTSSGGGGTLSLTLAALTNGATSLSQTSGTPVTGMPATVAANGTAHMVFGPVSIPGNANAVMPGSEIVFSDVTFDFHIESAQQICASLGGDLSQPTMLTLTPSRNPCVLVPASGPNAAVPTVQANAYHCP
jgi:hypothetical protein